MEISEETAEIVEIAALIYNLKIVEIAALIYNALEIYTALLFALVSAL